MQNRKRKKIHGCLGSAVGAWVFSYSISAETNTLKRNAVRHRSSGGRQKFCGQKDTDNNLTYMIDLGCVWCYSI